MGTWWLEEHLQRSQLDPVTRQDLSGKATYENVALRNAVRHYREHYQTFRIVS